MAEAGEGKVAVLPLCTDKKKVYVVQANGSNCVLLEGKKAVAQNKKTINNEIVWGTAIIEEKEDCVALGSVTVKQYKDPEIRKKIGLLLCEKWDTGANKNTGERYYVQPFTDEGAKLFIVNKDYIEEEDEEEDEGEEEENEGEEEEQPAKKKARTSRAKDTKAAATGRSKSKGKAVAQVHTHLMSINDQFTKKEQDKLQEALDKALKGAPKIVAGALYQCTSKNGVVTKQILKITDFVGTEGDGAKWAAEIEATAGGGGGSKGGPGAAVGAAPSPSSAGGGGSSKGGSGAAVGEPSSAGGAGATTPRRRSLLAKRDTAAGQQ